MSSKANYERWLNSNQVSFEEKQELLALSDEEINQRFSTDLEFGTGGLRSKMGLGTNRINRHTLGKITQGLANFLISEFKSPSVVIAYDSRINSKMFAEDTACILAANGIRVYLFDSERPTPELSFSVRELQCKAGIVITASHNPKEYNGYKIYGSDGGQVTPIIAEKIATAISNIDAFRDTRRLSLNQAMDQNLISFIGRRIDEKYIEAITKELLNESFLSNSPIKLVYTPLHGVGLGLIKMAFEKVGYSNYSVVKNQATPDGNFPTVYSPNPEEIESLNEAIKIAKEENADVVFGTDPDCDRLGVAIRNLDGNYIPLTGNQIGAILVYYILSSKKDIGKNDVIIKTIVTSDLGSKIAESFGVKTINTLTGFKFIGEKINEFEQSNDHNFIFGYEESYGYLKGTQVRDKDAVMAALLVMEAITYYFNKNLNLIQLLEQLYEEYGFYHDELVTLNIENPSEITRVNKIIDDLRNQNNIHKYFENVIEIEDYLKQSSYNLESKKTTALDLPKSNVVKLKFSNESWLVIRPSGTEPKIKIYLSYSSNLSDLTIRLDNILNRIL